MTRPINVVIVEDHAIFREGLKKVLSEFHNVEIIGEAENGQEFLGLLKKVSPDIVLMDIKMPLMDGIEATSQALKLHPALKIIILSMYGEEEYLYSLIIEGICGFVLKTINPKDLEHAIQMVHCGQQYFSPELNGMLAKKLRQYTSNNFPTFTAKENEVLRLLCKGFSTEQLASKLKISKRTVEGFRAKLLQKTDLNNTTSLVLFAIKNKLVSLEEIEPQK